MTKRILLIEDEANIRGLYMDLFQSDEFEVDQACDGQEGFRLATTNSYDVIISDLKMPNWNGVDSIKSICLVKPATKFIVVTGYAESDMADELRDHPAVVKMFPKPVDLLQLLDAIASC